MHPAVNSSGSSPKIASHSASSSHGNSGSDGLEFPSVSPSRGKGMKREREDDCFEPIKRVAKTTGSLEINISKIIERGELIDSDGVDKFVQLMQAEKVERQMDIGRCTEIARVIAVTTNLECLSQFVELRGVSMLDEWLQEIHKGKNGDSSSSNSKEADKSVEDFLLVLLNALDKLPVNLRELRMSNIGKSVNMLRSYKNTDIQKKARRLVDLWKKRVEAELVHSSAKAGPNEDATVPAKTPASDVSQCETVSSKKGSETLPRVQSIAKSVSDSIGSTKSALAPTSEDTSQKIVQCRTSVGGGSSDVLLSVNRDEKSCSSSLSRTSQSCSSGQINGGGSPGKEDARSSSTGSMGLKQLSKDASHDKKLGSGLLGPSFPGIHKETRSKRITLRRNSPSEKLSQCGTSSEKENKLPNTDGCGPKLIVKFPNRVSGPVESISGISPNEPSLLNFKPEQSDCNSKGDEGWKSNIDSEVITESWQSNESKDVLTMSDEGEGSPTTKPDKEICENMGDDKNGAEVSKDVSSSPLVREELIPIHTESMSTDILTEGDVRDSESRTPVTSATDVGMALLANVASREMSKSDMVGHVKFPANTLIVSSSILDSNCPSSHADMHDQEPKDSTEQIDEDIEKQAGATLAILRTGVPSLSFVDNSLPRAMNSSIIPGGHMVSMVKVTVDDTTEGLASEPTTRVDAESHSVANEAINGNGFTSAVKDHDESLPCRMESNNSVSPKKSTDIQLDILEGTKSQASDQVDSCIDSRSEQRDQVTFAGSNGTDNCAVSASTSDKRESIGDEPEKKEEVKLVHEAKNQDITAGLSNVKNEVKLSSTANVTSPTPELERHSKFGFDLNESCDEGAGILDSACNLTLPMSVAVEIFDSSLRSSVAGVFPASVTVTAAAKGPFNLPGDLLRIKGEAGWKGSAATSAFRPAEPRRSSTMQTSALSVPVSDVAPSKATRPFLDIDLNAPCEGSLEDGPSGVTSSRFDLNVTDQAIGKGRRMISNDYNADAGGPSSTQRGFDLNNCFGEVTNDVLHQSGDKNGMPTQVVITGAKMNNAGAGSFPSWFPGNTLSTLPVPSPGLDINPYYSLSAPLREPHRFVGISSSRSAMTPGGPILTASPALSFHSPFPQASFPFGTGFPMPSANMSDGTALVDSSSGRRQAFVPGSSQQSVPASAMYSSYYPRPFLVSLSDGNNNSSKQAWDLNVSETERRDNVLPFGMNQLAFANLPGLPMDQARMYQAAGAMMRREVPEGNWDAEKHKQQSWQ